MRDVMASRPQLPDGFGEVLRPYLTTADVQNAKLALHLPVTGPLTLHDHWDGPFDPILAASFCLDGRDQAFKYDLGLEGRESSSQRAWSFQYEGEHTDVSAPLERGTITRAYRWAFANRLRYNSEWRWSVPRSWHTELMARLGLLAELRTAKTLGWPITIEAVNAAAANGDLRMVQFLRDLRPPAPWDGSTVLAAISGRQGLDSAAGGQPHDQPQQRHDSDDKRQSGYNGPASITSLLQYLHDHGCPRDDTAAVRQAASNGIVSALDWLLDHGCGRDLISRVALPEGVLAGHLAVVVWAASRGVLPNSCAQAAANGHIHVVDWLRDHGVGWGSSLRFAATVGQAATIEWCIRHGAVLSHADLGVWQEAVAHGHVEVLQAAVDTGHEIPAQPMLCARAAARGQLHVLQWLRAHDSTWSKETAYAAARSGQLHTLEWALANGCPVNVKLLRASTKNRIGPEMEAWLDDYIEAKAAAL